MSVRSSNVISEAEIDRRVMGWARALVSLILLITVVGAPLIPFWLLWSISWAPKALNRFSARLTPRTLEVEMGVYFRKESTIPLDRITDIKLYDDPLMRFYGLRAIRVETAGQSGANASSEGNLIGIVDAVEFRDAILRQRELLMEGAPTPTAATTGNAALLTEIRDLLKSIDSKTSR